MIGEMRQRIILQDASESSDGMGGLGESTWSDFKILWAKIEPYSAKEAYEKHELKHRVTHKVTIRYLDGVTSDMRVKFGERYLQIKGIRTVDERKRFIELACEEGVPA